MSLVPNVSWAQREDSVWLTVELTTPKDLKVEVKPEGLSLSCLQDGKSFALDIKFFKPVVVDESKWSQHRNVDFYLKKAETEAWPRLLSDSAKKSWLKVDWSKWADSDDEGEKGDFDVSGMGGFPGGMGGFPGGMGGFPGGMGGFPGGMGGFPGGDMSQFADMAGDSDDDDLPELPEDEVQA